MMDRAIMKHKSILALSCLYLFHIISNYIWLKIDTAYLLFDPAQYHLYSLRLFEAMKGSLLAALFSKSLFTCFYKSGLFVGFITTPFYFLFGTSQDAAAMISGAIFLAILLFSVYSIGRKLQDERTGLLGAFIVSMYPVIFHQLRVYMFDLPLCAFVSLNIYLLICSDYFRNKFFTVLYALSIALGSLIKFNFLVFIIGPMLLVLSKGAERVPRKRLAVLLIIAVAIILFFSFNSLRLMFFHASNVSWLKNIVYFSEGAYSGRVISLIILWFYSFLSFVATLVNDSLSFFFSLIFIIGLIIVLRLKFKYTAFLLLPVLIPLFFVIFIFNTFLYTARYILPSYVFVALISSIGMMNIRVARIRRFIVTLILLIGFTQYFLVSYGCVFLPGEIKISLPDFLTFKPPILLQKTAFLKPVFSYALPKTYLKSIFLFRQKIPIYPEKDSSHPQKDYKNRQVINGIIKSCPLKKGDSFIFLGYNYDMGDISYPLELEAVRRIKSENIIKKSLEDCLSPNQYILTADYIGVMEGMREDSDLVFLPVLIEKIQKTKEYFYNHLYAFKPVYKVVLSDGRTLSVYKNRLNDIIEGPLEIRVRKGYIDFFYQGKNITEHNGFNTYFTYNHKRYTSYEAIFVEIEKPDADRIFVRLSWPGLDLAQVWELGFQDGCINWWVYLDNPKKILLQDVGVEFQLSPVYRNWQDFFRAGHFPETFLWKKNYYREIKLRAFFGNAFTIEPVNSPQSKLPGLLFRNFNENIQDIGLCSVYLDHKKARIIHVGFPRPTDEKVLILSGQIFLFTDATEIKDRLGPRLP